MSHWEVIFVAHNRISEWQWKKIVILPSLLNKKQHSAVSGNLKLKKNFISIKSNILYLLNTKKES